jgi:hypothetical protein
MYVTIPTVNAAQSAFTPLATTLPQTDEARLKPGAYLYYEGDDVE